MANISVSEIDTTATKVVDNDLLLLSKYNSTNLSYKSTKINAGLFQRFVTQETFDHFDEFTYYNNNTGSSNNLNFPIKDKEITLVEGTGHVIQDFNGTYSRSSDKLKSWANSDSVIVPFDCYIWIWTSGLYGSKNNTSAEDKSTTAGYGPMNVSFAIGTDATNNFFDISNLCNLWGINSTFIFPLKKGNRFRFEMSLSTYYNNVKDIIAGASIPIKVPSFTYNYRFIPMQ